MADAAHQLTGPRYFMALPTGEDDDVVREGLQTNAPDAVTTETTTPPARTITNHDVQCSVVVDVPSVPTRWVHA